MKQNNIWYLDRGKNFFTQDGKLFFEEMISIFNSLSIYSNMSSNDIIEKFPNKYKESGNPNALLTTVRNIGIINKQNELSKNVKDYLDYKLSYEELILENLSKINYDKENVYTVKPFFIICIVLYELYLIKKEYAIITKIDCIKYLYDIKNYDKNIIFQTIQKMILDDRDYTNVKEAVLDIWFNALNYFSIFEFKDKNALVINENEIDFYKAIYNVYLSGNVEKFKNGIYGCIPSLSINKDYNKENINGINDYLFGINNSKDVSNIFNENYFGIYKPFRTIKNIAIRKINESDPFIAESLYKLNQINNISSISEKEEPVIEERNCIQDLKTIILESQINTTYKFVLAKAIILNVTRIIENEYNTNIIELSDIAKVFIEHYWNEVVNGNINQSYNGKSKAIEIIQEFQEEFYQEFAINDNKEYSFYKDMIEKYDLYNYVIKKFISLIKTDVLHRFLLSNCNPPIYIFDSEKNCIHIDTNNIKEIYNNREELFKVIEDRNSNIVKEMNHNKSQ